MQITKLLCLVLLIIPLISCSKDKINKSVMKEKDLESQVLEAYREGLKSLKEGDVIFASSLLLISGESKVSDNIPLVCLASCNIFPVVSG